MYSKQNLLGFMSGLGCGVGIALLLAPKSGSEARSLIARGARGRTGQIKQQVKQQAAELRNSAADLLQKGQQQIQRHKEGLKRAVEASRQAYQAPGV